MDNLENLSVHVKSAPFRTDIQGLRALAVLAVVLFHLPAGIAPNGFVGVDVFFVISGYVITASTWRIESANPISFLSSFFRKRLARLIPALFVCLTLTELGLLILQPPGNAKLQAIQTGLFAFSGTSNLFLLEILNDYWFEGLRLNPFVHTWSLGVEFQFYFVFPFLFLAFLKIFGHRIHPAIWTAPLIVIIIFSVYLFLAAPIGSLKAFYLPHYRFWEFLLGVGAYAISVHLYEADVPQTSIARVGLALQKYAPTLLLIAVFFSDPDFLPQEIAVVAACLLSAMLIIINTRNRWFGLDCYLEHCSSKLATHLTPYIFSTGR